MTAAKKPVPTAEAPLPGYMMLTLLAGFPVTSVLAATSGNPVFTVVAMGLLLEGLTIGFFWRRFGSSSLKTTASVLYVLGYWGYIALAITEAYGQVHAPIAEYAKMVGLVAGVGPSSLLALVALSSFRDKAQTEAVLFVGLGACAAVALGFISQKSGSGHHLAAKASDSHHAEEHAAPAGHGDEHAPAAGHEEDHAAAPHGGDHPPTTATHGDGPGAPAHLDAKAHSAAPSKNDHAPHWSYDGETGPNGWGRMSGDWSICESGHEQSPVNIPKSASKERTMISLSGYTSVKGGVVDNGHTIQANFKPGAKATIRGQEFQLAQFHFHSPSEHEFSGISYPLELHLVHKNKEGKLAVIGVMIEEGEENPEMSKVLVSIPESGEKSENPISGGSINLTKLLPKSLAAFQYPGSLTTPPCSEGVLWSVLSEPITLSHAQVAKLRERYHHTNRPVMPLGERKFGKFPPIAH